MLLKALAKEKLKRAGGDKYGNETLMTKSSTADKQAGTVRESLAKNTGVGQGTLQRYLRLKMNKPLA